MSELGPKNFVGRKEVDDAVTLFANRSVFSGWKNVSITRELNSIASTISLNLTDKWTPNREEWRLKPGDEAHIHIGQRNPAFTGFIDKLNVSASATQRSISLSGRSKTADLVDCSITGPSTYDGLKFEAIAKQLLDPFGLKLVLDTNVTDTGAVFTKFTTKVGETVFEALDRLARERELLLYPSFNGNLVAAKKGNKKAAKELKLGVNIKSIKASFDNSERYSDYEVKAQNNSLLGGVADSTQNEGKATDAGIKRFRPLVLVAENATDNGGAEKRAAYEVAMRTAKSFELEVQVKGWYQGGRRLWDINELVRVNAPFVGVRMEALVKRVTYVKDSSGTHTALVLIRPDSLEFVKTKKADDDPLASLGL